MEKLTWSQVEDIIHLHNKENKIRSQFSDKNPLIFVVVYKKENWKKDFTEQERSYKFRSDNKRFIPEMGGGSIFANCLDGEDLGVRLDWVDWKIDYCYQLEVDKQ